MTKPGLYLLTYVVLAGLTVGGCKKPAANPNAVRIMLDWKPEPEFGGFYQAQLSGAFQRRGLDVQLKPEGSGAPMWQLVATGQTDFATTAADLLIEGRARGADVVALFAVYQTCPQGIMAHQSRGFTKLQDVFTNTGLLSAEYNPWLKYLLSQYKDVKVTIVGYAGGTAAFMARGNLSQQCFVTSEPILARRAGADPQTFLVADEGFNPYTTVLITRRELVRTRPDLVRRVVEACRDGWREYLDDPAAANATMSQLNPEMDPQTFTEAAKAQKPLIETEQTKKLGLGTMTAERWQTLADQLAKLKVIDKAPAAEDCFIVIDKLPAR